MSTYFHICCDVHGELELFGDRTDSLLNHGVSKLEVVCDRSRDLMGAAEALARLPDIDVYDTVVKFDLLPPIPVSTLTSLSCDADCRWSPRSEYDR